MHNWPETRFEDCVDLLSGFPFKSELFSDVHDDIPLVKGDNLHQGYIDWAGAKRWDKSDWNKLRKYQLEEGDIVVAMDRPWIEAGLKYSWIKKGDPKSLLVQRISRLRGINGLDSTYLRYIVGSPQFSAYLKSVVTGVNIPHISGSQILRFSFCLPPLPTQKKIASILSAYDDLIENNTQRIGLLEEMAEEIYKEWFVRMRFPGYEQCRWHDKEGHEVEKGTEGGLPEGWRENQLSQLCAFNMGQSPKSEHYNEDGVGLAFHQGVTNFNKRFPTHAIFCTDAKRIAEHGDILLSVRAPVGRLNIADRRLIIGRGLCAVRQKSGFNTYLYYHLSDVFKVLDAFGNGAVFNAVSKTDLEKIKTIIPHVDVMKSFEVICKPIDGEIDVLTQKNQVLQETRNLLLPRLISGKLSVDGLAEKQPRLAMAAEPEMLYGK